MSKKLLLGIVVIVVAAVVTTACSKKNDSYDYLVLVNKYTHLPDDWEENIKLVDTKNAWDEDIQVEEKAYEAYKKLEKELKDEGVIIKLDSTYRSVADQQELWDRWSKDPEKGIDYVRKYVAVPGYSEHHTGLAIDICLEKDGELVFENEDMIADRDTFAIIHSKLAKYGFILRYLEGREDSTGYTYEPWHLRYINDPDTAKKIMDSNMTLEEYLDQENDLVNNKQAAIYHIEKKLQEEFREMYKDQITNSRFNVTKIYTKKDGKEDETIKGLNLGDHDLAFEVTYQLKPAEGVDINLLMITDGVYNEELEWVTDISRLGIMRQDPDTKALTLENFGTGW